MKHYLRFMLVLLLSTVWCVGGYAEQTSFGPDWNSLFGTSYSGSFSTKANKLNLTGTSNGMTIAVSNGTSTNGYVKNGDFRAYNGYTITISSSSNAKITSITSVKGGKNFTAGVKADVGNVSIKNNSINWTGSSSSVKFTISNTVSFASITVSYEDGASSSKTSTTTKFGDDVDGKTVTVYKGGSFPAYKATATDGSGKSVEGTYKYTSSNTTCVTVDEATGQTAAGTEFGKADIKVEFTPTDAAYEGSSASYTIDYKDVSVIDPNIVFYESFDKCDGTGGNDNKWFGSNIALGGFSAQKLDMEGWKDTGKVFFANKCIRLGASSGNGYVTTKEISYTGDAVLTFKAGAWKGKKTSGAVVVTITNGNLSYNGKEATSQTIDIPNAAFGEFTMNIVGASEGMTLRFATTTSADNQFFLDEVKVTATKSEQAESVTLTEGNNDDVIIAAASAGKPCNVTLERTMIADGGWYTFCVPFDIEDIATTPLKDAQVRKYSSMSGSVMNFEETKSLKAAHAYLVRPTANIENPVFENVTVSLGDSEKDGANGYFFEGIYSEKELLTDGTNLFLGADNKFYIPTGTDRLMKALRGYFVAPSKESGSKMGINIDGETNYITTLNGSAVVYGKVYNLNGQYVGNDVKSLKKGVYVVNGRKFIVK